MRTFTRAEFGGFKPFPHRPILGALSFHTFDLIQIVMHLIALADYQTEIV